MRITLVCLVAWVGLWGCKFTGTEPLSEVTADEGPGATRSLWIKAPETLVDTMVGTWDLEISTQPDFNSGATNPQSEYQQFILSLYAPLGGTKVAAHRSMVKKPNEVYVLAIDQVSDWLADKLVKKQIEMQADDDSYMFNWLGFLIGSDDAGCFKDDNIDWCDFDDDIKIGSLTDANVDPANLSKEWRKRLMHNIQDVGDFFLLKVDNELDVPEENAHAPAFLLDQVFLPSLGEGPVTVEKESDAWRNVVYTVLASGAFFIEVTADQQ